MSGAEMPESVVSQLEYAAPAVGWARASLYPRVIFLGAAPLVAGVTIIVLYWATEWQVLVVAGFITVLVGVISVLVGAGILFVFWLRERRLGRYSRAALRLRIFLAALLLASNFPAAWACITAGAELDSRMTVMVTNKGTTRIDRFVLTAPGFTKELGPIPPGGKVKCIVHVTRQGPLNFTCGTGTITTSGTVDGYVTDGIGGRWDVTMDGAQKLSIKRSK